MVVRARLLIAATVVLGGAWLLGGGWRFDRSPAWWSFVLNLLLPFAVIFGLGALGWWSMRRSAFSAALDVRDGVFVAPPAALQVAAHMSWLLAMLVSVAGSPLRDLTSGNSDDFVFAIVALVVLVPVVVLVALMVLSSLRDRPRIELRPDGVGLFGRFGTHVVPWDAIAVGPYPHVSSSIGWSVNWIGLARPDLVRRRGAARVRPGARSVALPQVVATHPAFVAAVINHYLFYPQYRAAIGTPQEYERLCRALTLPGSELVDAA
ncbi:hypothetical protein [Phytohabitans kaempferiae]|uniref:DUF4328 domain-containing protein n=1 Tax=Phytohabitans kaempferiae TaxID=1620943 RepID=A0ABV6MBJ7_9ACTN